MPESLRTETERGTVDVAGILEGAPAARASGYAESIRSSSILQIAAEIRAMIARGDAVLDLTVGDFQPEQFPIPEALREHIVDALRAGETNYPPVPGVLELREAIRASIREDFGLDYPLDGIFVGGGARPILYSSFMATVDPGELAVFPVPSWNNHHYAVLSGARTAAIPVGPEQNFHLERKDLAPHLDEARLVVLCSPSNPTGTCISRDVLEAVGTDIAAENARRAPRGERPVFLVYDQVYHSLTVGDVRHVTPVEVVPELASTTILVDAVSKGLAGTGLRVGWAAGPPAIIRRMAALAGHYGAWAPRAEQIATARFLRDRAGLLAYRRWIRQELQLRLDALHRGFRAMREAGLPVSHIEPQGAIYLSVRFDLLGRGVAGRRVETSEDLRQALLSEAGFAVVPFDAFGYDRPDGWVRLSVGAVGPPQIREGLDRVRRWLESVS